MMMGPLVDKCVCSLSRRRVPHFSDTFTYAGVYFLWVGSKAPVDCGTDVARMPEVQFSAYFAIQLSTSFT